jgi:hypothetical protein
MFLHLSLLGGELWQVHTEADKKPLKPQKNVTAKIFTERLAVKVAIPQITNKPLKLQKNATVKIFIERLAA